MVMRKCGECPGEVQAVCRRAFGGEWAAKSGGGEGCGHPLDAVAEAWYAAGWTPGPKATGAPKAPRRPAPKQAVIALLPAMPRRRR